MKNVEKFGGIKAQHGPVLQASQLNSSIGRCINALGVFFVMSCCYLGVNFLATPSAEAVEGLPDVAIADCGSESFVPGDLPPSANCTYPNVGTAVQTWDLSPSPDYEKLITFCGQSLIYKNDDPTNGKPMKAVWVSAAHCVAGFFGLLETYLTIEPQPGIAFSAFNGYPLRPNVSDDPFVPMLNHLYQVATELDPNPSWALHPLFGMGNSKNYYSHDIMVYFLDLSPSNPQANTIIADLAGVEPLSIPDVGYLNQLTLKQLKDKPLTLVGYNRLTASLFGEDIDVKKNPLVPARHNRQYGPANLDAIENNFIKVKINTAAVNLEKQVNPCHGNSGSPMILNDEGEKLVLGVVSIRLGNGCQSGQIYYVRTDVPEHVNFLACAVNPELSIQDSKDCIDALSFNE